MSSANIETIIFSSTPGIVMPLRLWSSLRVHARGSIARLNKVQDSRSPCQTPLVILKGLLSLPLMTTWVWALMYKVFTVLIKFDGTWNFSSVVHR